MTLPLVSACVSTLRPPAPDRYVAPQFAPPPPGSLLLLLHLPANEDAYRRRDAEVRQRVADGLMKAGYRVAFVEPDDYALAVRAEWQHLSRTTATPRMDQLAEAEMRALATVAKASSEVSGSPLLLRTRLLTRRAELWQSHARWDGVLRPILRTGSTTVPVPVDFSGTSSGISLELVATGRDGRLLVKNYGGVALPFSARSDGVVSALNDPLADPRHVAEGVRVALLPLTGP